MPPQAALALSKNSRPVQFSPACLAPMMGRPSPNRVNRFGPTDLTVGSK
jgi:hypothetical protein